MFFSKYIKDGQEEKIKPTDISSRREYIEIYRNNLFCNEIGCSAKIEWADRNNGPIFRTWKRSKHADDCTYRFENDPKNNPRRDGKTILYSISKDHKKSALRQSNKKRREEEGKKQPVSNKKNNKTNDNKKKSVSPSRIVASVDPNAESLSKIREPRIIKRKCNDILPEDIGQTRLVRGYIDVAEEDENLVKLHFKTNNGGKVRALFYEAFRSNNSLQEFKWIRQIASHIAQGNEVYVSVIGFLEQREDTVNIQVVKAEDISIEDKTLAGYFLGL